MARTTEELITRYSFQDGYTVGATRATAATKAFAKEQEKLARKNRPGSSSGSGGIIGGIREGLSGLTSPINELKGVLGELGLIFDTVIALPKLAFQAFLWLGGAITAATAAFAGFASQALKAYGDVDSLKKGLIAVAGSAEEAEKQFKRLKEVAKLPGLGVEEAVRGSIRLQAGGFTEQGAERALQAVGNALATVGLGREELDGVILALTQIQSKGKVSAEEINQIAEKLPQFRGLITEAFGTADSEQLQKMGITTEQFISKLIVGLEKLPAVAGGVNNVLENLQDSVKNAFVQAGETIADNYLPAIQKLGDFIDKLSSSGAIQDITDNWAKVFGGGQEDLLVNVASIVLASIKNAGTMAMYIVDYIKSNIDNIIDKASAFINFIEDIIFPGLSQVGGVNNGSSFSEGLQNIIDKINTDAEAYRKLLELPDTGVSPVDKTVPIITEQAKTLQAIQYNTKQSADIASRQEKIANRILGGGSIGSRGITPVELSGITRRRRTVADALKIATAGVYQAGANSVLEDAISRSRRIR